MKRPVAVGIILLIVAITVIVSVLVLAQGEGPTTSQDGVAAGGGQRTSADDSITVTDVIGLAAVGRSSSDTSSLDLFAGLVLPGGIPPHVITGTVSGLGPNDATLNAILADMGTAGTVTVSFQWDSDSGAPYTYSTYTESMSGTGAFAIPISGLLDNKRYYYRAAAESPDGYVYGEEKSFLTPNRAGIIYVDSDAAGDDNGTSWPDAYQDLQSALFRASNGDELWVAAGTYKPGDTRTHVFYLKNQVGIYGGFAGTEGTRTERNWNVNQTILSGDIGAPGDSSDNNSYHVVSGSGVGGSAAVLDGFTIANGNADGVFGLTNTGGGMLIMNCSPTITNCVFTGNTAVDSAGGMYVRGGSPVLLNCDFNNNVAEYGGALYLELSDLRLYNCTFWNNTAVLGGSGAPLQSTSDTPSSDSLTLEQLMENQMSSGGAVFSNNSDLLLLNCGFSGNVADAYGAVTNMGTGDTSLINCILWGDEPDEIGGPGAALATFSDIKGGAPGDSWFGTGCINADPLWANPAVGDLHLQDDSPCIDTGTNTAVQDAGILEDYEGQSRIIGGIVDMGPDEFSAIFVDAGATGDNNGDSWTDAYIDLQDALAVASYGAEIWVAAGTYTPGSSRSDSFQMKNGVKIFGGFPDSGNPEWEDRDWYVNKTVLSGDIGVPGDNSDNCYHVLYHPAGTNIDHSAVLNGFVISGGMANVDQLDYEHGAGMYNSGSSSPTVVNCVFSSNVSSKFGGGMYNAAGSSPNLTNCIFHSNTAETYGGGIYNDGASPVITNCTFSSNTAISKGGGIYNENSSPVLSNCILWGNEAYSSHEMHDSGASAPSVRHCDIWLASGTYPGIKNINQDPAFVNPAVKDFRIDLSSPCIDSGSNPAVPAGIIFDIEGDDRILDGNLDFNAVVDMGADEAKRVGLTLASSAGGSVIDPGEGSHPYIAGSTVSILAEASPCYEFVQWTGTGTPAITNTGSPNTEILMDADYAIQAEFVIRQFNLTLADDGNGTTIPASGVHGPYNCGTEVIINAVPNACYSFDRWTGDTNYLTGTVTQAANSVIMPEENIGLAATFVLNQYDLTISSSTGGSVTIPGEGTFLDYDCGTEVAIAAVADEYHRFVKWTGTGSPSIANPSLANTTITMDGDRTIVAIFEQVGKIVDVYVNLQGGSRPVSGWEVPINIGFYPPGSPDSRLLNPASATYYFSGTTILSFYGGGTRAYFQCPQPVAPGTYDITADSATTLLNVRRSVGIW